MVKPEMIETGPMMEPKLADLPEWLSGVQEAAIDLKNDIQEIVDKLDGPNNESEPTAKVAVDPRGFTGAAFRDIKEIKSILFNAHDLVRQLLRELNLDEKFVESAKISRTG